MNISAKNRRSVCEAFLESIQHGRPDRNLARQVWDCTDSLPLAACDRLGLVLGSSFADAGRAVLE